MSPKSLASGLREHFWLVGAILVYLALYFFYYPPIYAYRDESMYLAMAYVLRQGKVFLDSVDIPMLIKIPVDGHIAPYYSLGNSVALIPFTLLGEKFVYLYGLAWHLTGIFVLRKLAGVLKLESRWPAILYLFFPAFVLYSRTIMSDLPVMVLFMTGCWLYFRANTPKWKAGIFFGIVILFKTALVIYAFPFGLMLCVRALRNKGTRPLLSFVLGIAPFALAVAVLNTVLYGSPFLMGYSRVFTGISAAAGQHSFSWSNFCKHSIFYGSSLLVVYPLMLSAVLNKKIRKPEILICMGLLIAFFSTFGFLDSFPTYYAKLAFATRYIFPVIVFLLLGYGDFLDFILKKCPQFLRQGLIVLIGVGLIGLCAAVNGQHQIRLNQQYALKQTIYQNTETGATVFYDRNTSELIQAAWGVRDYREYIKQEDFLDYLKGKEPSNSVYLVKRDILYPQGWERLVSDEAISEIRKVAEIKKIAQQEALTVYQIT